MVKKGEGSKRGAGWKGSWAALVLLLFLACRNTLVKKGEESLEGKEKGERVG